MKPKVIQVPVTGTDNHSSGHAVAPRMTMHARSANRFTVLLPVWALAVILALSACRPGEPPHSVEAHATHSSTIALQRATNWILAQQSPDGGWHSNTYGSLKSGVGTTALALEALSLGSVESDTRIREACLRGFAYLSEKTDALGMVCAPDGRGDSPVYATALLLTASNRMKAIPQAKQETLVAALINAQQIPANGWPEDASGRGGWGVEADPATAESNAANLSVTAHVLRALHTAGAITPEVRRNAFDFLKRCRTPHSAIDPGFWFTPKVTDHLNKGGWFVDEQGLPQGRPYHVATCDGILAMEQLNDPSLAASIQEALDSLGTLPRPQLVTRPLPADEIAPSLAGLFFYDAAAFSRVCTDHPIMTLAPDAAAIRDQLIEFQQPDGCWENPIAWMREDDTLIATSLAIIALQHAQKIESLPNR